MATATVDRARPTTAPTEAEIRAVVQARIDSDEGMGGTTSAGFRGDLRGLCEDAGTWLAGTRMERHQMPRSKNGERG